MPGSLVWVTTVAEKICQAKFYVAHQITHSLAVGAEVCKTNLSAAKIKYASAASKMSPLLSHIQTNLSIKDEISRGLLSFITPSSILVFTTTT